MPGTSPPIVGPWSNFPLRDRLEELTGIPVVLDTAGGASTEAERVFMTSGTTQGGVRGRYPEARATIDVARACLIDPGGSLYAVERSFGRCPS